jgi:hypothetical protein
MTNQHPITPPPELVRHWSRFQGDTDPEALWFRIANEAAQWGADQELEACVNWLDDTDCEDPQEVAQRLRAARRPKPPSLAEQATAELDDAVMRGDCITTTDAMPLLRAALKRLAELEALPD